MNVVKWKDVSVFENSIYRVDLMSTSRKLHTFLKDSLKVADILTFDHK